MVAASNGNKDLLELLIDRKASLDLQSYVFDIKCKADHCKVDVDYLWHLMYPRLNNSGST